MRLARAGLLAGVIATIVVAMAPAAHAHALMLRSDPERGAVLDRAPARVVLTFTEAPDPTLSTVRVLDATGGQVDGGPARPVPGKAQQLTVPLRSVPDGVYTVAWRVVSRVDGHLTAGSFAFGVGVSPAGAPSPPGVSAGSSFPSPSPFGAAGRWALYAGMVVLLAAAVVGLVAFGGHIPARGWSLAVAWAVAAAGLVTMTLAERGKVGVPLGRLLGSATGRPLVREAIGLVVTGVAALYAALRPGRRTLILLGLATAGTMLLHVLTGHADAAGRFQPANVAVQWLHLLSVGVWVGGLVWLLVGTRGGAGTERAAAVRRFSTLAGFALAGVAVTGVLRAWNEVGGPGDWRRLFDTSFGVAVSLKVALFGGLVLLGARNRYVNVPKVSRDRRGLASLRRAVTAEVVLAAGVLGVTAVLTQLPPSTSVAAAAAAEPTAVSRVEVTGSDFGTTVRVRLAVTPGTAGPNRFEARVTDFDTGAPVDATRVALRFRLPGRPDVGGSTLELQRRGDAWVADGTDLSILGRWEVTAVVQGAANATEVPLEVTTRFPPQKVTVAAAPGQPTLYTIELPGAGSVQAYLDPGTPGANQVHVTFFDESGNELPIASARMDALPPTGPMGPLALRRFSTGHFVADTDLAAGRWTFVVTAQTKSGDRNVSAYFAQRLET